MPICPYATREYDRGIPQTGQRRESDAEPSPSRRSESVLSSEQENGTHLPAERNGSATIAQSGSSALYMRTVSGDSSRASMIAFCVLSISPYLSSWSLNRLSNSRASGFSFGRTFRV